MIKTITRIVRDANGDVVSGLQLTLFKHTETSDGIAGVEDVNSLGKYTFTIPQTYLSKYYDIRITGGAYNPYEENIEVEWEWIVRDKELTAGTNLIHYNELYSIDDTVLPEFIPNAVIDITAQADRPVILAGMITPSLFNVKVSSAGADDTAKVTFIIKVGK